MWFLTFYDIDTLFAISYFKTYIVYSVHQSGILRINLFAVKLGQKFSLFMLECLRMFNILKIFFEVCQIVDIDEIVDKIKKKKNYCLLRWLRWLRLSRCLKCWDCQKCRAGWDLKTSLACKPSLPKMLGCLTRWPY